MQLGVAIRLGLVVLDDFQGQLHHPVGKGNQHHGSHQIEHRLEVGNSAAVHRADPEARPKYRQLFHHGHDNQEQHRTDGIKGDVHHAGTLCVLGRADGADHGGGDAGAQVDAHNHGVGHGKGDAGAGHRGHGLEHTHSGGGALHDDGQNQAEEDAEQGVGKERDKGGERFRTDQGLDAVGHQLQTHKQHAEADADIADGL